MHAQTSAKTSSNATDINEKAYARTEDGPVNARGDLQIDRHKDGESTVLEGKSDDEFGIDWLDPGPDARNPQDWSVGRKWMIIVLVTGITLIPALMSTAFAPAVPLLMQDFDSSSAALASFTVSVYVMGYCIGPPLIAPMSEIHGRAPILHIANVAYLVTAVVSAVSNSLSLFIIFRLFMGFAGCASVTLGGGVIADLMPPEKRGVAMTAWSTGPILLGALTCACFLFLKETYGPRILARVADQKRRETGDPRYKSTLDKGQGRTQLLRTALMRPVKMLFKSPIIALLALYTSIINAYCTILFATIGTVFEDEYNFSVGEGGLAYFGLTIGFVIGQISVGAFSDSYVKKMKAKHDGQIKPEDRLPPLILGSLLLPSGFLWYGWATQEHTHWIVPILGSALVGIASMFSYLPVQLYLVDTYTVFAASAIASNSVVRSICAALVPLGAGPLYNRLGYGWGNSVLAFISLGFVPIALVLLIFGERVRTHPRFQPKL
ncbi:MAG: hypothetical protein Q9217_000516 [Psora testacea]